MNRYQSIELAGWHLIVYVPPSYHESDVTYPVAYVQDGGEQFDHNSNQIEMLFREGQIPELILVGSEPHNRNDEYTPWPAAPLLTSYPPFGGRGRVERVTAVMKSIPADAKILVHFDVDVMHKGAMAAAYSPSETGLSLHQAQSVLDTVLCDPRVVGMEVTEFSGLRDTDGKQAERLVQLLTEALATRAASV